MALKNFEKKQNTEETLQQLQKMMPNFIKRRWKNVTDDGDEMAWEEYFEYFLPVDEAARPKLELLQMAKLWRKRQEDTEWAGPVLADGAGEAADGGNPPSTLPPPLLAGEDLLRISTESTPPRRPAARAARRMSREGRILTRSFVKHHGRR